jgi:hypothetical protein
VPRGRSGGSVTVTILSTAATVASPRVLPAASIMVITAGVTGSLKRNSTVFGAVASTLPSDGSVDTSDACAEALVACESIHSSVARAAIRRIAGPDLKVLRSA